MGFKVIKIHLKDELNHEQEYVIERKGKNNNLCIGGFSPNLQYTSDFLRGLAKRVEEFKKIIIKEGKKK